MTVNNQESRLILLPSIIKSNVMSRQSKETVYRNKTLVFGVPFAKSVVVLIKAKRSLGIKYSPLLGSLDKKSNLRRSTEFRLLPLLKSAILGMEIYR